MKLISIVTPCYNEEDNVEEVYNQVKAVFANLPDYSYEHIFIDNASTDKTVALVKEIIYHDKNIRLIVNSRNFGHLHSPYYGLLQANGDAVILLVADLQDPPELIIKFIKKWEEGYKIVVGVKPKSKESRVIFQVRKLYYRIITKISEIKLIKNFTGFGLYDKKVIDILREFDEPEPYFRGLISEIGFDIAEIPYIQPIRQKGKTKNNFYSLYDLAMLGITSHSKLPLRLATMLGFACAGIGFVAGFLFFIAKLMFWSHFSLGIAPIIIGLFFLGSVQLFCIGLLGEYIALVNARIMKRPLVIEEERINWSES